MKFPVEIEFKDQRAKIYRPAKNFAFYRISFRTAGKRRMLTFGTYGEAKKAAEEKIRELHNGQQSAGLTAKQSQDAIVALQRLVELTHATGRKVSLLSAVSEFAEASSLLKGRSLIETAQTFLQSIASVQRKDISEAVEEFIIGREAKTKAAAGQRAQLSKTYTYNSGLWLRQFAKTFPSTAICDLGKQHLDLFMAGHSKLAAKSKNHYRATIRMFLAWCVRKDYLSASHRLFEADGMVRETAEGGATDYFRPAELEKLLQQADSTMRPIIALQGLAGIRGAEALRLTWEDVFVTAGHVTISATKSKTRSRRLVEICPALEAWLKPYRKNKGPLWNQCRDTFHANFSELRVDHKIPARNNGLRHAFCTYHFALYSNDCLTAAQAGNSPVIIHAHYKGLVTKAEAEKWFSVKPTKQTKTGLKCQII